MKAWIDVMRDIEHLIDDYERILDGWQEGGVEPPAAPGSAYRPPDEALL